jgi:hypothetical protein
MARSGPIWSKWDALQGDSLDTADEGGTIEPVHSRWLGLALVVGAFAVLVAIPDLPGLGLLLFLLPFVSGMLLLTGILGRPADLPGAPPKRSGSDRPLSTTEFRYRAGRLRIAVVWFLGLALVAGGVACVALIVPGPGGGRGTIWTVGAILSGPGLFLAFYAWRRPQSRVRLTPDAIEGVGILGTVRIPWNEVVALRALLVRTGSRVEVGRIYRVYSTRREVSFSDGVRDAEVLLAAIAEATGLAWE